MNNEVINGKIILIGNSGVGKTTISNWALTGSFNDNFMPTVGGNYISKEIKIESTTIKLQIWDTAGDEKYRSLIPMFYRDAKGAVLVYSICEKKTFQDISYFVQSLNDRAPDIFKVLVGNKSDMEDSRQVSIEEGMQYADEIQAKFIETSARSGDCINNLLQTIAEELYKKYRLDESNKDSANKTVDISNSWSLPCQC